MAVPQPGPAAETVMARFTGSTGAGCGFGAEPPAIHLTVSRWQWRVGSSTTALIRYRHELLGDETNPNRVLSATVGSQGGSGRAMLAALLGVTYMRFGRRTQYGLEVSIQIRNPDRCLARRPRSMVWATLQPSLPKARYMPCAPKARRSVPGNSVEAKVSVSRHEGARSPRARRRVTGSTMTKMPGAPDGRAVGPRCPAPRAVVLGTVD